jgi:hypothetical protein
MVTSADKRQVTGYAEVVVRSANAKEAAAAMDQLRLVCRRSGVAPSLLLADARRRPAQRRADSSTANS